MAGLPSDGLSIFGAFVGLDRPNQNGLMISGLVASRCVTPLHVPLSLVMYAVMAMDPTRRCNRLDELESSSSRQDTYASFLLS